MTRGCQRCHDPLDNPLKIIGSPDTRMRPVNSPSPELWVVSRGSQAVEYPMEELQKKL